jgi:hypothetical protein
MPTKRVLYWKHPSRTVPQVRLAGPRASKGNTYVRPTIASVTINSTRLRQNVLIIALGKEGKAGLYLNIFDERKVFSGSWAKQVSLKDAYDAKKGVISYTVEWETRGGAGAGMLSSPSVSRPLGEEWWNE